MKIGILTFHRCINYGSYWQARCLVEGLRGQGHDAELLDHDAPDVRLAEWRCAFQPQLPARTFRADLRRYAAKTRRFMDAFDKLPQSPRFALDRPEEAGAYDTILIGSDEVWNFRHPWYGGKPIFFGDRLRARRLASYAASFGNHDAAHGIDPGWATKLGRFEALSVRDENSRSLVRQALGREPELVLDPCLQFPLPSVAEGQEEPYLALYGHGFPDWFAVAVRAWADENHVRIVSIGYRTEWADEQRIEAGPEEFAALMAGAEAVATNFFHGCVFALHYGRPFVSAPSAYRFNKVRDLTRSLSAERHMVRKETPAGTYAQLMEAPLDPAIGARLEEMRARSSAYLASVLG
ncbi:polysaccharide pyruvyl transferase family protein [Sphingobium bisphenolivorans]|uniref:polysaccharide pyruvyl transferase family protein n=1 Tax=Sphingobium bisphenolivorans TaxID=1335760 RepID=UPI00039DF1E8|nr:polysaccharide pyruvyl transferase family protein [Sphingobium bisphenolivorans]